MGNVLSDINSVKDLGLTLNKALKWSEHINNKLSKCHKFYQMFKRKTSSSLLTTSKLQLYKAVFVPTILYGAECWSPSRSDINEMEKMNKKLLKWIVPYAICYKDAMIRLNVLPLPYFQVMKELLLLSNIVENKFDVNFSENYQRVSSRRGFLRFSLPKVQLLRSTTMIYDAATEEALIISLA